MSERRRTTLTALANKRREGVPLTMITCYDYAMAHLVQEAELDMVLVGDSLGMTMLGYDLRGLERYASDVREGSFPSRENWFPIPDEELAELEESLSLATTGTLGTDRPPAAE